jgi:hypothetical protein
VSFLAGFTADHLMAISNKLESPIDVMGKARRAEANRHPLLAFSNCRLCAGCKGTKRKIFMASDAGTGRAGSAFRVQRRRD